jgi:acetylornithine deacetylase
VLDSITTEEVKTLLREAVAIDSVNHNFRENRAGEASLCDWVELFLQKHGIPHRTQSVRDRQQNIVATIEGRDTGRILCFEAHLDTTTARGMSVHPFGAEEIDGSVYGRGSCDCKGALAAMLVALKNLHSAAKPPPQTVMFAATVDKEVGLTGIDQLLDAEILPSAAVVAAPTNLSVGGACKGCLRWRIQVGESPQSYTPSSRNAISDAIQLISEIEETVGHTAEDRAHALLGASEIRPSRIRANSLEGFLPASCAVDFECYTVPTYPAEAVLDDINDLVSGLRAKDSSLKIAVEPPTLNDVPAELPESSLLVQAALKACREVQGAADIVGFPENGHANRFAAAGIETITLGPGAPDQHRREDEHVPLDQLAPAAMIYQSLMRAPLE